MSFFDTTPIGRIVSRFSKDINSVDFGVPDQLGNMFDCVLSLICTMGVIVFNTPEFIAVILPLGIIYLVLQVTCAFTYCIISASQLRFKAIMLIA